MELIPRLTPVPLLPGPRAMPLVGRMGNVLRFFGDPVGTLLSLHRRFGRYAAANAGNPGMVFAFGVEANRQILSDSAQFLNFAGAPFAVPPDSSIEHLFDALTAMNGDLHRRHRRLLMPAFRKAAVDGYRDGVVAVAERALAGWRAGTTFDVAAACSDIALRVAMSVLFGIDSDEDADRLGAMGLALLQGITSPAVMALPYRVPGTPYHRLLGLAVRLEAALIELIRRKRAQPGEGRDVLSILVRAHDEDGSTLTDAELVGQANVLFVAGHETTSFTLAWTMFLLSQHPDIARALVDELTGKLGGDAPSAAEAGAFPLLDAVVKESMRVLPATPFLFIRRAAGAFELGPHTLPPGSQVVLSPLVTHRLPELYPEPSRFRPERWGSFKPSPYEYLPFGAGPRTCIGGTFAAQTLRLVLPMIVQRFRFSLVEGARVSRRVQGITHGPKHGLPMEVVRQDRAFRRTSSIRGDIRELVDLA